MSVVGSESPTLDNVGNFSSGLINPGLARRRRRWQLKNTAAALLPSFGVSSCGHSVIPGASGVTVFRGPGAEDGELRTWLGGVVTCKSVWACPVCAAKITERRRQEVLSAVRAARDLGLKPVMVTLTFSHSKTMPLVVAKEVIALGLQKLKSGRAWQNIKARYGVVGSIRALEVTHGERNGWHPHSHELIFLAGDADIAAFGAEVCARWIDRLGSFGYSASEEGFSITDTDAAVAEYIAKWGHEPHWDVGAELTKLHSKTGRSRAYSEHSTPFQLLAYAADGDTRCGELFVEFANLFRGAKQLFWSAGLHALLLGEDDISDEALIDSLEEQGEPLVVVSRAEWRVVVWSDSIADFLHVCASGSADDIEEWLRGLWSLDVLE